MNIVSVFPECENNCHKSIPSVNHGSIQANLRTPPLCAVVSPSQNLGGLLTKARKRFENGVESRWLALPGSDGVQAFWNKDACQISRADQTLHDDALGIAFPLSDVFK